MKGRHDLTASHADHGKQPQPCTADCGDANAHATVGERAPELVIQSGETQRDGGRSQCRRGVAQTAQCGGRILLAKALLERLLAFGLGLALGLLHGWVSLGLRSLQRRNRGDCIVKASAKGR